LGGLDCLYLTAVKLAQVPLVCAADAEASCGAVLRSSFASVGGVPLAAIGLVAYVGVALLNFTAGEDRTRRTLLWWLTFALCLTSGALMLVLIFVLKTPCVYCAISAFMSAGLLACLELARADRNGARPRAAILAIPMLVVLGAGRAATLPVPEDSESFVVLTNKYKPNHPPVRSTSGPAEVALAKHLTAIGAVCYSAWWCPHCQDTREQFGSEATELAPFAECSTVERKQNELCKEKDITGYPTWIIGDTKYPGYRSLSDLAAISDFTAFAPESFRPLPDDATEYIWN